MSKYHYFVSFSYGDPSKYGFGNGEYARDRKILNLSDINSLSMDIEKNNNLTGVVILFYRLFDEE